MIQARQIEAFRAVMLTRSMTGAAEMIGVTQPAVSRLVRDLEAELGLSLFERRGNKLVPVALADIFFEEVNRSFVGLKTLQAFAAHLRAGQGGSLRVAGLPAMIGFLPRVAARFGRDRPHLRLHVDCLPSNLIRDQVAGGLLDLGVAASPSPRAALTVTPLVDYAVVVLPRAHRLAAAETVSAKDLEGENLILLRTFWNGSRHAIERALHGLSLGRIWVTPIALVACNMAAEGAGVAIVDPFSAAELAGRDVSVRPFRPASAVGTAVIQSSERPLSDVAADFLAAFVAEAGAFLDDSPYLRAARLPP